MNSLEFHELSTNLGSLVKDVNALTLLHAYRYGYLVRASPLGRSCKNAAATFKAYLEDQEHKVLRTKLEALSAQIQLLLKDLP